MSKDEEFERLAKDAWNMGQAMSDALFDRFERLIKKESEQALVLELVDIQD